MDFDATSLYLSALMGEKSIYAKLDCGFAFQPQMNDVFVNDFNEQTFNQDCKKRANLKKVLQSTKCYIPTFAS